MYKHFTPGEVQYFEVQTLEKFSEAWTKAFAQQRDLPRTINVLCTTF